MDKEKSIQISQKLSSDRNDYISAFRNNLFKYIDDKDITIREISEASDVPFSTINTFLYGNSQDCKLSTAVKLARALGVSIDELVGAETINEMTRDAIVKSRTLSKNSLHLIKWFINHQAALEKGHEGKRIINVMHPLCQNNGCLKPTNDFDSIDISFLDKDISSKVFIGFQLSCENYMPLYTPYEILLVANDRNPIGNENSIIIRGGNIFIAKRKTEHGITKYYSIRDGKFRCVENDVDEVIGYIVCTINDPKQV